MELETQKIIQRDSDLIRAKVNEFERGENPDKSRIGYYSSPAYRLFKRQLNPLAGGSVDLILTGAFTGGLAVESLGNRRFIFDSSDDKTPFLVAKYGLDIMGINQQEWEKIQKDSIAPKLIKFIKQQLKQ